MSEANRNSKNIELLKVLLTTIEHRLYADSKEKNRNKSNIYFRKPNDELYDLAQATISKINQMNNDDLINLRYLIAKKGLLLINKSLSGKD